LRPAAEKGARVLNGSGMCIHQAVEGFRRFVGLEPDLAVLQRAFATAVALRGAEAA